jgi:LemA protein
MHAHNVVFVGPAGHQALNVGVLQGVVKSLFGVVWGVPRQFRFLHACILTAAQGRCARALVWLDAAPGYSVFLCSDSVQPDPGGFSMRFLGTSRFSAARLFSWLSTVLLAASLTGCGYNDFQRLDEESRSAWSEVLNQYQRRADLIPNIVATVKGEANFEQETLTQVIEARAKATSIQMTPEMLNNPAAMQQFQAAQGQVSSALSRLMVVVEQYPNLKANQGFSDLRVQLEGTENRITVARNRYIQTIQAYNVLARSFPTNLTAMVFSYAPKANFQVENEAAISAPPKVDFNKP